jgi:alkylmercury lyase
MQQQSYTDSHDESREAALEELATRLSAHLDCKQDIACREILRALAESGQPLAPARLAASLQMSQDDLAAHLDRVPDTEFDADGHIVGWGITLVPTQHQFQLKTRPMTPLYTWCAFDTVLFPPLLDVEAQVDSVCAASRQPISFVASPAGVTEQLPATAVVSLLLPAERCDCVRDIFCQQSLFFQSKSEATLWLASRPEAVLLSVEEAAVVGQFVARQWPR